MEKYIYNFLGSDGAVVGSGRVRDLPEPDDWPGAAVSLESYLEDGSTVTATDREGNDLPSSRSAEEIESAWFEACSRTAEILTPSESFRCQYCSGIPGVNPECPDCGGAGYY